MRAESAAAASFPTSLFPAPMPVTAGAPLTSLHDPRLQWTPHPPPAATAAGEGLAVVPRAGADLWSRVGPAGGVAVKSDGACLVAAVEGDRRSVR